MFDPIARVHIESFAWFQQYLRFVDMATNDSVESLADRLLGQDVDKVSSPADKPF